MKVREIFLVILRRFPKTFIDLKNRSKPLSLVKFYILAVSANRHWIITDWSGSVDDCSTSEYDLIIFEQGLC